MSFALAQIRGSLYFPADVLNMVNYFFLFHYSALPYPHTRQHMLYVPKFYYRTVWENRSRTERIKAAVKTPSTIKSHFPLGAAKSGRPVPRTARADG